MANFYQHTRRHIPEESDLNFEQSFGIPLEGLYSAISSLSEVVNNFYMVRVITNKYFQCSNGTDNFVLWIVFLIIPSWRWPDKWPKHVAGYSLIKLHRNIIVHVLVLILYCSQLGLNIENLSFQCISLHCVDICLRKLKNWFQKSLFTEKWRRYSNTRKDKCQSLWCEFPTPSGNSTWLSSTGSSC